MVNSIIAGELYETLTGQIFELGRQLRQPNGYPFNPFQLKLHLQAAIEGRFCPGEVYRVKLGDPTTTDQIAQEWREAGLYVNDYLTQANFPLTARETTEDAEIEIIDPGCSFSEEEGLKFLEAAGLERPTYEHALRFAEQCGRTTTGKKLYIVFLHEPWLAPDRYRRFVCVLRYLDDRRLHLYCPGIRFSDDCVLAGVRRRKQPQSWS
jgi:hypothetical protein